jgi:raffinose/stachyose/melibiose transport system permease protein
VRLLGTDQISHNPASLPLAPTLGNLRPALGRPDKLLQLGLRNSLVAVCCSVALLAPLGSALSFYLSQRSGKGQGCGAGAARCGIDDPSAIAWRG